MFTLKLLEVIVILLELIFVPKYVDPMVVFPLVSTDKMFELLILMKQSFVDKETLNELPFTFNRLALTEEKFCTSVHV